MLVFNNQQRSGYEEIASYSPRFYRNIKEMDAVFRFAGFTLDLMAEDLEGTVSNQFVEYMDEELFSRYEAFLGIKKYISKTLEERKAYVNAMLVGSGKISKDKIVAIVNQFIKCECSVDLQGSDLHIQLSFDDDPSKYMKDIRQFLCKFLPAHLKYKSSYRVEYAINNSDLNGMRLRNIWFRMSVPFWYDYVFDGSWLLDGSIILNQRRRYNLLLGLIYKQGEFYVSEQIEMISVKFAPLKVINEDLIHTGVRHRFDISHCFDDSWCRIKAALALRSELDMSDQETVSNAVCVTKTRDYWFLDGEVKLDGSRKLNSVYVKEEIEE